VPSATIIVGDGSSPRILREAQIQRADMVAAVTGDDEDNLVIALQARNEFRVPRVIARVNNPKNAWLFTQEMGVDAAVNQAGIMAQLIQEEISIGEMVTLLKLRRGELTLVEERLAPVPGGRPVRGDAQPPAHRRADCDCAQRCGHRAARRGGAGSRRRAAGVGAARWRGSHRSGLPLGRIGRCASFLVEVGLARGVSAAFGRAGQRGHASFGERASTGDQRSARTAPRERHTDICASCGKETQVPFVPRGDRPVSCAECCQQQRRLSRRW